MEAFMQKSASQLAAEKQVTIAGLSGVKPLLMKGAEGEGDEHDHDRSWSCSSPSPSAPFMSNGFTPDSPAIVTCFSAAS